MNKKRIDYTPLDIEQMSPREIRKAYSELRKIAKLRQLRLRAAFPHSSFAKNKKWWKFPTTKSMKSTQKVAEQLAEVSRYLTNKLTLVREQRKMLEELSKGFVNMFKINIPKKEIPHFFEFLDELRSRYDAKMVDSLRVAELFQAMQQSNISEKNIYEEFSFYIEHLDTIKELKLKKRIRPWTAKTIRAKFTGSDLQGD